MTKLLRSFVVSVLLAGITGFAAAAPDGVHALFNVADPAIGPFPSDQFTTLDAGQITGRRVALPKPDCAKQPSDCADIAILNTLDGFNLQPRIVISFDGPIDPSTVTSKSVLLVELGTTPSRIVGINEIVWDPATHTLIASSDELLAQHTRFVLIATNGILDPAGNPVQAPANFSEYLTSTAGDYRDGLAAGLDAAASLGIPRATVVTASVFTTMNATAILEKIRDQIHAAVPQPASFVTNGVRTVFPRTAISSITVHRQTKVSPPGFEDTPLFTGNWVSGSDLLAPLEVVAGSVGIVAFGTFTSPNYLTPQLIIPPTGTLTGTPVVQGTNTLPFCLVLPSGARPAKGWPVAIMGHYLGGSMELVYLFASVLAKHGFATIAFNAVGHGFGPLGTTDVNLITGQTVTLPSGGRGSDTDGNGVIASSEGLAAVGPSSVLGNADGVRQTVADSIQLVRVIQVGMDVDGDGQPDLDPLRLYYFGSSLGGNYGIPFLAVEKAIRAGAPAVAGGSPAEVQRLGSFRSQIGGLLQQRIPSLINSPGLTQIGGMPMAAPHFNENKPLRNLPPLTNDVAGAMDIQRVLDYQTWARQPANPAAYAPHLRKRPLAGMAARPVLIVMAKGDQTVPGPTNTAIIRAGDLADVTTYFRFDLAYSHDPKLRSTNPHIINVAVMAANGPTAVAIATGMQEQIATFFATDGARITRPEPAEFFETPIKLPLPENVEFVTAASPPRAPVDAAVYETALSPGSLFTIFGTTNAVGGEQSAGPGPLPTTLSGVMVSVNGKPAPLFYVGRNQVNGQVPYETTTTESIAQVISNGISAAPLPFVVSRTAPRLFSGQGGMCVAQNDDGSLNSESSPAKHGRYFGAYLTGLGAVNPPLRTGAPTPSVPLSVPPGPVSVSIGGRSATPTYVGMIPGFVGLAEVVVLIPPDLPGGLHAFSVTVGNAPSNTCRIAVSTR